MCSVHVQYVIIMCLPTANSVTETTESPTTIPQFKPTTMTMVPTTSEATTSAPNTVKELEEVVLDNQAPPTTPPPPVSTEKPISEDHGRYQALSRGYYMHVLYIQSCTWFTFKIHVLYIVCSSNRP